ncbi:uncharacterized protein LOC111388900 [Olea europaea var. sylvestris]|uniref:uncharacterized protein LOC111388900 n=1 Tax=Olea europaea var. sylvestris TaxID=158386 RepID=UPI000C1D27B8|nr:uncharacterized protein LOC111388900 [Olea europaea var. sylvestris]
MPTNRYFTMISNIVEFVNAVTKAAKKYPIEELLESLRQTVQSCFCKNRDNAHCTFTKLATKYEKLLREMSHDVQNLKVSPASHTLFEVRDDSSSYMIDITKRTCCCRMSQVGQLPCPHALAVFATLKFDVFDFCSYYYTTDAYVNTYKEIVMPVGKRAKWSLPNDVKSIIVLAPNQKRSSD